MTNFSGRVAIVTGGANGMGEATAHTFASRGATVVIADKDTERSPLVESEIRAAGGDAHSIVTDIREQDQVVALVEQVKERWGRIDAVDNNAAGLDLTANDPDLLGLEADHLMETLRANVLGMFLVTKAVLPTMLEQSKGSIVNMASVSGMAGESSLSAYGISKAAVIQFTRQIAVQYGKQGIRANAIAPAFVNTRNNKEYASQEFADVYLRHMLSTGGAEPQDIANVVVFLSSDEAALINGHVVPVDGGITEVSPIVADVRGLGGHTV